MQIQIEAASRVPIFAQIVRQVRYLIAAGRLRPGEELPAIRNLADRLVINPNTVARAYRELEAAGVLETRGRFGTFVASVDPADSVMTAAAHAFAEAARAQGLGKADALRYIDAAFE